MDKSTSGLFKLRDAILVLSIVSPVITIGGAVGGYHVLRYRVDELIRRVEHVEAKTEMLRNYLEIERNETIRERTEQDELGKRLDACCPRK